MSIATFCTCILGLLLTADGPSKLDASYYPLNEGMRWEYEVEFATRATIGKAKAVTRVKEVVEKGGRQYTRLVTVSEGIPGAAQEEAFVRIAAEGVLDASPEGDKIIEICTLPFPVQKGETRTSKVDIPDRGVLTTTTTIEAIESLDTVSKVYKDCAKVVMTITGTKPKQGSQDANTTVIMTTTTWYAPGVGAVQQIVETDKANVTKRLTDAK
jgi:hypothetical protein